MLSCVHREHATGCGIGGRLSACWEVSLLHSLVINEVFAALCRDQTKGSIPNGSFLFYFFWWSKFNLLRTKCWIPDQTTFSVLSCDTQKNMKTHLVLKALYLEGPLLWCTENMYPTKVSKAKFLKGGVSSAPFCATQKKWKITWGLENMQLAKGQKPEWLMRAASSALFCGELMMYILNFSWELSTRGHVLVKEEHAGHKRTTG